MLRGPGSVIRARTAQRVAIGALVSVSAAWVVALVARQPDLARTVPANEVTGVYAIAASEEPRSLTPDLTVRGTDEADVSPTAPELTTSAPASRTPSVVIDQAHLESSSQPVGIPVYRVQQGDTLALVAAEAGLRVETLLWANHLDDPALLQPDQEIMVPTADGAVFTLETGDTLRGLADRTAVPLEQILAANSLPDPDKVQVGTQILVPGAVPTLALVAAGPGGDMRAASSSVTRLSSPKEGPVMYTVQSGDSLVGLEAKFGIDAPTLRAANQLDDPDLISVGTVLRILPVSGIEHVVAPGERLDDIAARYQTVLGLIIDFNGIADPDLVRTGDRLIIPGGQRVVAATRRTTPS